MRPFKDKPLDEYGFALAFAEVNRGKLWYHNHKWYQWTDTQWTCSDDMDVIVQGLATNLDGYLQLEIGLANYELKEMMTRTEVKAGDDNIQTRLDALQGAISKLHQRKTIDNLIALARNRMKLPAGKEFDGPDTDFLLNCENGVLDLRTAGYDLASDTYVPPTLVSHEESRERGDLITKLAYVNYDPDAPCPEWKRFLESAQAAAGDDRDNVIDFLAQLAGAWLTGSNIHRWVTLVGGPSFSGKSTFTNVIGDLLGKKNKARDLAVILSREALRPGTHTSSQKDIFGRRLVLFPELNKRFDLGDVSELLKQWTGNDGITARGMRENNEAARQTWHLVMTFNNEPLMDPVADDALWKRILYVPFATARPESEQKDLPAILAGEMSGILNWCLRGWAKFQAQGGKILKQPEYIREAKEAYGQRLRNRTWFYWERDIREYVAAAGNQPFGPDGPLRTLPAMWLTVDNLFGKNILNVDKPDAADKARLAALMTSLGYTQERLTNPQTKVKERVYIREDPNEVDADLLAQEALAMIEVVTRVGIEAVPIRVKGELVDVRQFLLRRLAGNQSPASLSMLVRESRKYRERYLQAGQGPLAELGEAIDVG